MVLLHETSSLVWVANRDSPITGGNGSLTLTATSLDLLDRRGTKVWTSGTFFTSSPQAFLLDSGNLVVNDTVSGIIQWQSFDYPCDSLLPGLRIGYDTFTNHVWYLTSWKHYLDPSPGDYYIKIDPNRLPDLLLFQGAQLKYRMGTWNGQGFSGVPALKANNLLAFNMTTSDGSAYYSFKPLDRSILWRFVIDPDGLAHRWRSNQSNDNEWVEYWHLPQDQCDNYAYCGPNAACYNGDCHCLQEFVPKSPSDYSQRNLRGGCVRNVVLSCSPHNGFAHLSHFKVPDTVNATMVRGKSLDDCSKLCLGNCSCSAYTVFGDNDCVI
ncbi:Receptor-like serine/threonine-protein kinase SD1-8, partial [Dichanthelium oligosanthes]